MLNRTIIRRHCRRELEDTAPPYLWSDEALQDVISAALVEYSRLVPQPTTHRGQMIIGQRLYRLPDTCLRPIAVEWPIGQLIPRTTAALVGEAALPGGQTWQWSATLPPTLSMQYPARVADEFAVQYLARRQAPADDDSPWPVADDELPVIVLLAAEAAWAQRQVAAAKRGLPAATVPNPFSARLTLLLGRRRRIARGGNLRQDS